MDGKKNPLTLTKDLPETVFDNDLSISGLDTDEKKSDSGVISKSVGHQSSTGSAQRFFSPDIKLSKEKVVMDSASNRGRVAGRHVLKPHEDSTRHKDARKHHEDARKHHEDAKKHQEDAKRLHEDARKRHEDAKKHHEDARKDHEDAKQDQDDAKMDRIESNQEPANNMESDVITLADKQSKPETDMGNSIFTRGWTLKEEDLLCLPLVLNKYRIEEIKASTNAGQSLPTGKRLSGGDRRSNLLRQLKKTAEAPGSSYMKVLFDKMGDILGQLECDIPKILEATEFYPLLLPCTQCYEKYGWKGENFMTLLQGRKGSDGNYRCSTCGGQLQTLGSFGKMIRQMREVLEKKDLVPRDVVPDGNCMFAAVVDQLRIRGDFSFTTDNLRQTAVNYLRENPTADDGTPLEMFLTDEETWPTYLHRMSRDGEWGDHMILRALAFVINKKIIIYGGTSGQSETILCPKADTCVPEEEDEASNDNSAVYLGHVGESHYVSLRPKRWRQELLKGVHNRRTYAGSEQEWPQCPEQDINFILRQVFRMTLLKNNRTTSLEDSVLSRIEMDEFAVEIFGSRACNLVPCQLKSGSSGIDISIFFPSVKEEEKLDASLQNFAYPVFITPNDTEIVSVATCAKGVDLIAVDDENVVGHLKLIPKISKLWRGQTTSLIDNTAFVKVFEVNFYCSKEIFALHSPNNSFDMNSVLAFKSSWPDTAKDWPHRDRKSGFPDENIVQNVVKNGCHVIPFTPDERIADIIDDPIFMMSPDDNHTWVYSFAAAEKEMCCCLSSEQVQSFQVFKALVDSTLRDIPLPISVLKSVFFYACENIRKLSWRTKPGTCLLILLKKLAGCFKNGRVSHYFMPERNLLNSIPEKIVMECYKRLEGLRLQPVVVLYILLDQLNAMSSEIGCFVEEIIENIHVDAADGTQEIYASQTVISACTELLPDLIKQDNYQIAMLVFLDMIEGRGLDVKRDGSRFLRRVMWSFHIGFIWCFALYVDIKQQTTLTSQLCEGYGRIHVTEIFGPDCIEELPNTLVPECFSIGSGYLEFPIRIYQVLLQCTSGTTVIRCMKYYLKRYGELAGDSLFILPLRDGIVIDREYQAITAKLCLESLHRLYVDLYNFCIHSHRVEEFREMMPVYTLIAENLGSQIHLSNIRIMWNELDRSEKKVDAQQKFPGSDFYTLLDSFLRDCEKQ